MSDQQHYRSIFKSSSLIGGSALINVLIGMVRTKFVAVLLGPAGVGLAGTLPTILGPINTIASMGIATSGVRQIAEANGRGDRRRISELVSVLRRTVWFTGALGCLTTIALSPWLSRWTFKTGEYTGAIAFLALTILLNNIAVGQSCLLRGTRRIADLAKLSIWGAVNGTLISIPCYYFWGVRGVVVSLFLCSVASLTVSWAYARRVKLERTEVSLPAVRQEAKGLLSFGLPLMLSDLQMSMSSYLVRLIVIGQFGLAGVGLWGAATNISSILVNFVLSAMSADYYPRLVGVAHDNTSVSREVNAQTEIALLLATPGLLATIMLAPLGIQILYSGRFNEAIPVLRWFVYGVFGRVISWPLGYILIAKGYGKTFLASEVGMNLLYLFFVYICGKYWGLNGTGVALVLLYGVYIIVISWIAHRVAQTHWTLGNVRLIVGSLSVLVLAGGVHLIPLRPAMYYVVSAVVLIGVSLFMARRLSRLTGITFSGMMNRLLPAR